MKLATQFSLKIVMLIGILTLTACQTMTAPIASATAEQDGENWRLTQGVVAGKSLLIDDEYKITLALYDNQALVGKSAINNYRAPVKINGHRIEHTGPVITTMMAGPEKMMRVESDYLGAIDKVDTIKRQGDELVITGEGVELYYVLTTNDAI